MLNFKLKLLLNLLSVLPLAVQAQFNNQYCNSEIPTQHPASQYTDNSDGTVTDNRTGLMWKKCSLGQNDLDCTGNPVLVNWKNAHLAAEAANTQAFAGYTNWRLPNIKELMSLAERSCEAPAINLSIFPITQNNPEGSYNDSASFWSSSPYYFESSVEANSRATMLDFGNASSGTYPVGIDKTEPMQALLVRDTSE